MDRTETAPLPSRGSQSKLSAALFFVVLAALLFRVVTAVTDRESRRNSSAGHGPPPLVRWAPLEKAAAASRASGNPILYDFTAEWCAPCHRLDAEGWGDPEIAAYLNAGFVAVRVMDRSREEGRNPPPVDELERRHSVEAFPTLIVAGPDGEAIGRAEGWGGRDALRTFLEESKAKAAASGPGRPSP